MTGDGAATDDRDGLQNVFADGTPADAGGDDPVADALGEASEDDEPSGAENFGLEVRAVVALVTVGTLFFGPTRLLEVGASGPMLFEVRDVAGSGPFTVVAGATAATDLLRGFPFPAAADELAEGYRSELAIGIGLLPLGVLVLLAAATVLFPVLHYALAGQLLAALGLLVLAGVLVAVALNATIVLIALVASAGIYFAIPSFVGVSAVALVGELAWA